MATSGTFALTFENADFIAEAFERCGLDPDSITGRKIDSAMRSLNLMFVDWQTQGVKQYKVETITLDSTDGFTTNAQSITLNSKILRVLYAQHKLDDLETPMYEVGRQDYQNIADKTITGSRPDRWFLDRQRGAAEMYFWPVLDNDDSELVLSAFIKIEDAGNLSNNPDVQMIWFEAVASGLAARLSLKYAIDRHDRLKAEAKEAFNRAKGEDRATGPTRLSVSF
ncbi:MAG: hypothetical protein ACXWYM_00285 [Candidatus Binatia bacterium]